MIRLIFVLMLTMLTNLIHSNIPDSLLIRRFDALAQQLYTSQPDSVKELINDSIRREMANLLSLPNSIVFPYDSLKFVKSVTPADLSFRLITWAVPFDENKFGYFGYLQKITKNVVSEVIELTTGTEARKTDKAYTHNEWPGAVYNQLIETKTKDGKLYTLFGWIGSEPGKSVRTLETMMFAENGEPVFGHPVFAVDDQKIQHRIIFEFTDQVPFHLNYERQLMPGKRKKKSWMIVFNRLGGNNPSYGRRFTAPAPMVDTFDAYIFEQGRWIFFQNIDARYTPSRKKP